jgi:hypothetical protein
MADRATEARVPANMDAIENGNRQVPDEESPLLSPSPQSETAEPTVKALAGLGTIIAVLLLGKTGERPINRQRSNGRQVNSFPMPMPP